MRTIPLTALLALGCGNGTVEEVVPPGCPTLEVQSDAIVFADVGLGESVSAELVLEHGCAAGPALAVQVLLPSGAGFTVDTPTAAIDAGASTTLTVSFTADGYRSAATELFLLSNDAEQPQIVLPLSATVDADTDGDGFEAQEVGGQDCDDSDARVNPEAPEAWNGVDDDCDGIVDRLSVVDVEHGWVSGGTYRALAHLGNLGFADLDGEGTDSVLIGSQLGFGYGYLLDASDFRDLDDEAGRYADVSWNGVTSGGLGVVGTRLADNTGDGVPDLVVQGADRFNQDRGARALVVFDGTQVGVETPSDTARLRMTGGAQYPSGIVSDGDLDGDGTAEVVAGVYISFDDGYPLSRGTLFVHSVAGESGEQALVDDAESVIEGQNDYDYFGRMPVSADLDGDGYDDLIAGASGEDSGASSGGMLYVIPGGTSLPGGRVDEVASARIQGETAAAYLGYGPRPLVTDVDGDEVADLVFASVYEDAVYVFSDASSVDGELDADDADYIVQGPGGPDFFGIGLAAGDFDGNGSPELAVGAPDTNAYRQGTIADRGEVTIFDLTGGSPRITARILAEGRQDTFGQTLLAGDLDGDGRDELITDAPGYEDGGRVYFLTWSD